MKKQLKEWTIYLLLIVVVYVSVNIYRSPTPKDDPIWHMQTTQHMYALDEISKQNTVLVYFWGSWCHICQYTSPNIDTLAQSHAVLTVAVSSGDDTALSSYMQQNNYRFLVVNDNDAHIFRSWHGQVTPSYMIVKDGRVVQSFVGFVPLWMLRARMAIADWLQ